MQEFKPYQCMLSCGHTLKLFIKGLAAAHCHSGWFAMTTNTCIAYFRGPADYTTAQMACRQMDGELVTLQNFVKIVVLKGYLQHMGKFLNIFTGDPTATCYEDAGYHLLYFDC